MHRTILRCMRWTELLAGSSGSKRFSVLPFKFFWNGLSGLIGIAFGLGVLLPIPEAEGNCNERCVLPCAPMSMWSAEAPNLSSAPIHPDHWLR